MPQNNNRIYHKRSVKGTAVPTTNDLAEGELAINVRDGKLFTRKDADGSSPEIVELGEKGIGTLIQWGGLAVHQFKQLGFHQSLPKTEQFFERCLMLPMNIFISNNDVEYICEKIKEFYRI